MIPYFALETLQNKKSCSKIISPYFTLVHQWKPRLRRKRRKYLKQSHYHFGRKYTFAETIEKSVRESFITSVKERVSFFLSKGYSRQISLTFYLEIDKEVFYDFDTKRFERYFYPNKNTLCEIDKGIPYDSFGETCVKIKKLKLKDELSN